MTDPKEIARREVEARSAELIDLSRRIHANPEPMWEERQAAAWVAAALEDAGFAVERGVADLPTALHARAGGGPLNIAICAEYDALPAVGHACGHNVIAAAAVGAGLALARVADDVGVTVRVMGTPAEEGGGGKIVMQRHGVFDGVHAAMMVHPAPLEDAAPEMIAVAHLRVAYTGKEAHAAAAPWLGVNAADALTVAQVALGLLRQHILPSDRLHGIVTKGGDAPNIVPAATAGEFLVRARTLSRLEALLPKVHRCLEAGAVATGAALGVEMDPPFADVRSDAEIAAIYRRNAEALGRVFEEPPEDAPPFLASTDFGNISQEVPAIHPLLAVEAGGSVNHQPEFAAACATPSADRAIIDGALAMAWTAVDLATAADVRRRLLRGDGRP